jgi:CPA2 family monovalent cation:H+ antiporter-2
VAPDMVLQAGDIVVLRGATEAVARAEKRLLK